MRMKSLLNSLSALAAFLFLLLRPAHAVETMPVSELKPGMHGITYTVLQGTKIEPIETEVIGVVHNHLGAGMDLIICKLVDPKTALTEAVHGMSGSPLYIDGKLVGALSRRITLFEKDGQCGFTPIADMLKVGEKIDGPSYAGFRRNDSTESKATLAAVQKFFPGQESGVKLESYTMPLAVSGVDPVVWQKVAVAMGMDGNQFLAVPGGGQTKVGLGPETLVPGAPVAAVMMTGPVSMAGTGTLTWREGNRIVAFGHPMFGEGETEFPMASAEIVTTLPSYYYPFKMSNTGPIIGTITQDRSSAIAGVVGPIPKLASYRVERTSNGKPRPVLAGEFMPHPLLSPMLIAGAFEGGLTDNDDISRTFWLHVTGELRFVGHKSLKLDGVYSGEDTDLVASLLQILRPVTMLYRQPYERLRAESLSVKLDVTDKPKVLQIASVHADRSTCKPGDTIGLSVELIPLYGERSWEHLTVKLPDNLKSGTVGIRVSSADSLNEKTLQRDFDATRNVEEMISLLNRRRMQDQLFVQVFTRTPGVVVADRELPSLPPTVREVMQGGNQSPGASPLNEQIWTETSKPLPGVVNGQEQVEVEVK